MIVGLDVKGKKMMCSQCNKDIKDKYYRLDNYNKVVCESCYSKSQKCQVCTLPSKEVFLFNDLKICGDCFSLQYRCKSCRKDIKNEEKYHIFGIQGFFCESCYNLKEKCSRCGQPAFNKDQLTKVDDDVYLCEHCLSHSITDIEIAKTVLVNTSMILNKKIELSLAKNISLNLVTTKELEKIYRDSFIDEIVIEQKNLTGFTKRDGSNYKIYVKNGLQLSSFISSLTHEYARTWQLQYCSKQMSKVIWEGFADWISCKLLWLLGYHDEIIKIEQASESKGFGLKKIQIIERSKGIQGVLEFMNNSGQPVK